MARVVGVNGGPPGSSRCRLATNHVSDRRRAPAPPELGKTEHRRGREGPLVRWRISGAIAPRMLHSSRGQLRVGQLARRMTQTRAHLHTDVTDAPLPSRFFEVLGALSATELRRAGGDQRVAPDRGVLPAEAPETDAEPAGLRDLHAQPDGGRVRVPDVVIDAAWVAIAVMVA